MNISDSSKECISQHILECISYQSRIPIISGLPRVLISSANRAWARTAQHFFFTMTSSSLRCKTSQNADTALPHFSLSMWFPWNLSNQTTDLWVSYMQFTSDSSFSGKLNCHLWLTARFLVNLQTWKGLNKALDCGHRLLHTATLLFAFFGIAVFQSTGQSLPHSAVGACKQSHFLL